MSKVISLNFAQGPVSSDDWMIVPRPVNDWQSRCIAQEFDQVKTVREIQSNNALQHAYLVRPIPGQTPKVMFEFIDNAYPPDPWIWDIEDNQYTCASSALTNLATELTQGLPSEKAKIHALVENAAEHFGYAHPDERFNAGCDEVPMLCGTARGSCVDINTYLIAAARSIGIKIQYMAGYWFHPDKTKTHDMHCWLAFECHGEVFFWDLAHHLKWGVENLAPGLNPAGGRRVPMTCGRGLRFETPHGEVSISHFSEPLWISPACECSKPELQICLDRE